MEKSDKQSAQLSEYGVGNTYGSQLDLGNEGNVRQDEHQKPSQEEQYSSKHHRDGNAKDEGVADCQLQSIFEETVKTFQDDLLQDLYGFIMTIEQKLFSHVGQLQGITQEMQQLDMLLQSKRDGFMRDTGLILNSGAYADSQQ